MIYRGVDATFTMSNVFALVVLELMVVEYIEVNVNGGDIQYFQTIHSFIWIEWTCRMFDVNFNASVFFCSIRKIGYVDIFSVSSRDICIWKVLANFIPHHRNSLAL